MYKQNFPRLLRGAEVNYRSLTLVFVLLLTPLRAAADDHAWTVSLDKDEVTVELRREPGKSYRSFRATTEINAGQASAIALLQDHRVCTQWLYRCEESRILQQLSPKERLFYQVTDLPFPARSRDAVFHAVIQYHPDDSVEVIMTAAPEELAATGHVRITEATGSYLLEALPGNRTRVTWQQYVDPAGALPAWLVNSMMNDLPYKSLIAFRELVLSPPYASARFVYDDNQVPVDIHTDTDP